MDQKIVKPSQLRAETMKRLLKGHFGMFKMRGRAGG